MKKDDIEDFGFTTTEEVEFQSDPKMKKLEELIIPLLKRLIDSSDSDKIVWPNRREPLEDLVKKILEITRS